LEAFHRLAPIEGQKENRKNEKMRKGKMNSNRFISTSLVVEKMKKVTHALLMLFLLSSMLVILESGRVSANYTTVQIATGSHVAGQYGVGSTTNFGYVGSSGVRNPSFCAGLETACNGLTVQQQRIEISGTDPNGNPLPGTAFNSLAILSSPDGSSALQNILQWIFNALLNAVPYGIGTDIQFTESHGGTSHDWTSHTAWVQWDIPWLQSPTRRGLDVSFNMQIPDLTLEGTYTISIHYSTVVFFTLVSGVRIPKTIDLYDTVYYTYINRPSIPIPPYTFSGSTSGVPGTAYSYAAQSTDPNGDSLKYVFDWNDGSSQTWYPNNDFSNSPNNWVTSGQWVTGVTHAWIAPGTYNVKVGVYDSTGAWSGWSPPIQITIAWPTVHLTLSVPQAPAQGFDTDGTPRQPVSIWVDGTQCQFFANTQFSISLTAGPPHTVQAQYSFDKEEWKPGYYYTYTFMQWSDGVTSNSRTITLTTDKTLAAFYLRSKYARL
jgi:hypothetical protein